MNGMNGKNAQVFHDVTVTMAGEQLSERIHDSATLVPAAVDVFRSMLEESDNFEEQLNVRLNVRELEHLKLKWTDAGHGDALATFFARDRPLTTSALVHRPENTAALNRMQNLVARFARLHGIEPASDLLFLTNRPLIATAVFPVDASLAADLSIVADAETCLAAAYFLKCEDV